MYYLDEILCFEEDLILTDEIKSKLNDLFGSASAHIYLFDLNSCNIWANTAQTFSFGFTSADGMLGKSVKELGEFASDELIKNNKRVIAEQREMFFVEPGRYKGDVRFLAISTKRPVFNNKGDVIGVFGISIIDKQEENNLAYSHFIMKLKGKGLTQRESECAYYYALGKTTKNIALHLMISSRTVESYIISIKNKFDVNSKTELIDFLLALRDTCIL